MKPFLVPVAMLLLGVGAGVGLGLYTHQEEAAPGVELDRPEGAGITSEPAAEPDGLEFARLNNQFIVPLVSGDAVTAMVVMSLTIEVDEGGTEAVFQNEPRLRDRFLRTLFDHANAGGFDAGFTQNGAMNLLKNALLETARGTLGSIVQDVLIVDIVRQEV